MRPVLARWIGGHMGGVVVVQHKNNHMATHLRDEPGRERLVMQELSLCSWEMGALICTQEGARWQMSGSQREDGCTEGQPATPPGLATPESAEVARAIRVRLEH